MRLFAPDSQLLAEVAPPWIAEVVRNRPVIKASMDALQIPVTRPQRVADRMGQVLSIRSEVVEVRALTVVMGTDTTGKMALRLMDGSSLDTYRWRAEMDDAPQQQAAGGLPGLVAWRSK